MSRVVGLSSLVNRLNSFGERGVQMIKDEIEGTGREIEERAKQLAPVDLGTLRRSINYVPKDSGLSAMVTVNVSYAPYQEFGTGGLVNVPPELKELAEYYKGRGVRQINLRPQPFLYPAYIEGRKKLLEDLRKGLERLSRQ